MVHRRTASALTALAGATLLSAVVHPAHGQPAAPASFQPGMWEIVSTFSTPDGRAQNKVTSRICYRAEDVPTPAKWLPPQRGLGMKCRESDVKTSLGEVTWKLTCDGDYRYAGTGRLVLAGSSYSAGVQMSPRPGSKGAKVEQVVEARRIGACT